MEEKFEELYLDYAENSPIDNMDVWRCYQELRRSVAHLRQEDRIHILECATELANVQEKAAFLAALQLIQE